MSKVRLYGSTSGFVELAAPAISDDGVLVLPTAAQGFGPAGIGSNVVQTVKTDVFTTSSGTFTAITGFSASITPSSATSKILVMADMKITNTGARGGHVRLLRGASAVYLGDTAGSRPRVSASGTGDYPNGMNSTHATVVFLDSPATAAAVTYSFDARVGSGDIFALNRYSRDSNGIDDPRMPSSITLIEVAA